MSMRGGLCEHEQLWTAEPGDTRDLSRDGACVIQPTLMSFALKASDHHGWVRSSSRLLPLEE